RLFICVRCLRPRSTAEGDDRAAQGWLEGEPWAIELDAVSLVNLPIAFSVALDIGVAASATLCADRVERFVKVRLRLENREQWRPQFDTDRDRMLCSSLVGAHLLLA